MIEEVFGFAATTTPPAEILTRQAVAALFGMIIGLDREWRRKPAGLRTHMLVCLASSTFTLLAMELAQQAADKADPVRIIEAVTAGAAFLGAGSIIQSRGNVTGMTTGASIWLAGAIGLACGAGLYGIALVNLLFAVVILTGLGYLTAFLERKRGDDEPRPR